MQLAFSELRPVEFVVSQYGRLANTERFPRGCRRARARKVTRTRHPAVPNNKNNKPKESKMRIKYVLTAAAMVASLVLAVPRVNADDKKEADKKIEKEFQKQAKEAADRSEKREKEKGNSNYEVKKPSDDHLLQTEKPSGEAAKRNEPKKSEPAKSEPKKSEPTKSEPTKEPKK